MSKNIGTPVVELGKGSSLRFEELDWDAELPAWLALPSSGGGGGGAELHLVLAADCTYNSDSRYVIFSYPAFRHHGCSLFSFHLTHRSPALVNTLSRLAAKHSKLTVAIAMKMRHDSERVFFDLMDDAGFAETALLEWPLPGDVELGEEKVFLHVYRLAG